jgi:hypothetical protein
MQLEECFLKPFYQPDKVNIIADTTDYRMAHITGKRPGDDNRHD